MPREIPFEAPPKSATFDGFRIVAVLGRFGETSWVRTGVCLMRWKLADPDDWHVRKKVSCGLYEQMDNADSLLRVEEVTTLNQQLLRSICIATSEC